LKRVLIITYYWPPSSNAGVHRWLKFTKYLRFFGWEPIIYTSEINQHSELDESLLKDIPQGTTVIRRPVWEPYNLYKWFIGKKKHEKINVGFLSETKKPRLSEKISVWIRGNIFIPDARCYWIKPSVKFLYNYLAQNPVDAVVSTGPPHTTHLIALNLIKKIKSSNPKWMADFRDPWTFIDFYDDLKLTHWADKKHHRLEHAVLMDADEVITVSHSWAKNLENLGAKNVKVITNGFDYDDLYKGEIIPDNKFSIVHIGSLVKTRNPVTLWKALSHMVKSIPSFAQDLEIKLVGKTDYSVIASIEEADLKNNLTKIEFVPHNDVIKIIQQSQILLLLVNNTLNAKGIIPGKFFEYLSVKRPIFVIGLKEGDIAQILNDTGSGKIVDFNDYEDMVKIISEYYELYNKGRLSLDKVNIDKYSRKKLTENLTNLLNLLTD
jgi:glycosyltransferase involved in cell wall biosynthesis